MDGLSSNPTISELYRAARERLAALSDAPQTEALLLCGHFLGVGDRAELLLRGGERPDSEQVGRFLAALAERPKRPLQYILGAWPFDGMSLEVGEGVLVPREDTLALVEATCERLAENARLLDLCAGTGAVGLAIARRRPDVRCLCVEWSPEALPYLERNIARHCPGRVEAARGDVLAGPQAMGLMTDSFDAICANPPYIPAGEIDHLAREVRQEPRMALDGGTDGLVFYRIIARDWLRIVREGGLLAVEIGKGQEEDVARIFVRAGWGDIGFRSDFSGVKRVIIGTLLPQAGENDEK